jgi:hypothetical protein
VGLGMRTAFEDFGIHHENISDSAIRGVGLIGHGLGRNP